jgi:hypothetical protein
MNSLNRAGRNWRAVVNTVVDLGLHEYRKHMDEQYIKALQHEVTAAVRQTNSLEAYYFRAKPTSDM